MLTVTNPTDSVMTVNFRQAEEGDDDFEIRTADVSDFDFKWPKSKNLEWVFPIVSIKICNILFTELLYACFMIIGFNCHGLEQQLSLIRYCMKLICNKSVLCCSKNLNAKGNSMLYFCGLENQEVYTFEIQVVNFEVRPASLRFHSWISVDLLFRSTRNVPICVGLQPLHRLACFFILLRMSQEYYTNENICLIK